MKKVQPCLLLAGDSLVEYGDWPALLPGFSVVNSGRAGETVAELLHRAGPLTLAFPSPPDGVLVMIGTNNLARDDLAFLHDYGEILGIFQEAFPAARVVANCLFPVSLPWLPPSAVPRLNEALARLAERQGAGFLDCYDAFLDTSGAADAALFEDDGVHLAQQGYAVWAARVRRCFADKTDLPG